MKRNKNIIILTFVVLVLGAVLYSKVNKSSIPPPVSQSNTATSSGVQTKIFQSTDLKFSIQLTSNMTVKDLGISVNLYSPNGEIKVSRNGTQYPSLKSHLDYFDSLRGVYEIESKDIILDNYPALRRLENSPDGKRLAYYVMVDSAIYTLSTSSPALFGDLDKIAHSFRYTP